MDYAVGDKVCILPEPPDDELAKDIWVHWIDEMDDYCGQEARIVDVSWIEHFGAYGYSIDMDEYSCTWCENCFVVEPDLQESEFNPSILFQ